MKFLLIYTIKYKRWYVIIKLWQKSLALRPNRDICTVADRCCNSPTHLHQDKHSATSETTPIQKTHAATETSCKWKNELQKRKTNTLTANALQTHKWCNVKNTQTLKTNPTNATKKQLHSTQHVEKDTYVFMSTLYSALCESMRTNRNIPQLQLRDSLFLHWRTADREPQAAPPDLW